MKKIQLSKRLKKIADLLGTADVLADVGCDHAFLSIFLCQEKKIRRALALDVRQGPLALAAAHVEAAGFSDRIACRLSDGFSAVKDGEANAAVIAGMGGALIRKILEEAGEEKLSALHVLVLGPQSEPELVRGFLFKNGFMIEKECMVEEEGKYYPLIRAVRNTAADEKSAGWQDAQEEVFFRWGKYPLEHKDPVLHVYLQKQMAVCRDLFQKLGKTGSPKAAARAEEIREEIRLLEKALSFY